MKTSAGLLFGILVCSLLFASCRARFYTPNRHPIPLFSKQGDVYIDASTNVLNKYDLTAGVAVVNGIGVYAGYGGSYISRKLDSFDYFRNRSSGNMLNTGLGFFLPENVSGNFRLEVYGDYATGMYKNTVLGSENQFFNGKFKRVGIMPNIGYGGDNFSLVYSARLSRLTFSGESYSDSAFWASDIARLNAKSSYNLVEHALLFRFGFKLVKFQAQFGAYQALNAKGNEEAVPALSGSVMFGVVLNLNVLGKGD